MLSWALGSPSRRPRLGPTLDHRSGLPVRRASLALPGAGRCTDGYVTSAEKGRAKGLELFWATSQRTGSELTVQEIVSALSLEVAAGADELDRSCGRICFGFAELCSGRRRCWERLGDLAGSRQRNRIAIAALLDLVCVIITEGARPDDAMLTSANEKGIPTLLSSEPTFAVVGRLFQLGISGSH